MKSPVACIVLIITAIEVLSKDVSESERANRAAFIQRLLNKEKYLEGRVKLVGGPSKFEGTFILELSNRNLVLETLDGRNVFWRKFL